MQACGLAWSLLLIFRVGQNHIYIYGIYIRYIYTVYIRYLYTVYIRYIYTVYIRYSWLENYQIYGVYTRIYTVLANPTYFYCKQTHHPPSHDANRTDWETSTYATVVHAKRTFLAVPHNANRTDWETSTCATVVHAKRTFLAMPCILSFTCIFSCIFSFTFSCIISFTCAPVSP